MVERDAQGTPKKIKGFSSLGLWDLDVQNAIDAAERGWPVSGSWAAAVSNQNLIAHFGYLRGTLAWEKNSGSVVLSLERTRERDREVVKFSVYGHVKSTDYNPRMYLRDLEANPVLQSLVYGELLGRAQPWVSDLENSLPALPGGRVVVPLISEPIVVDGHLSEGTWTNGAFDASGRIGEVKIPDGSPNAPLLLRWTEEAVYVATRLSVPGSAPVFELGVLPALESSLEHTGRFFVRIDANGVLTEQYKVGNVEQGWKCTWESGVTVENGIFSVELRIPLSELEGRARPADQKRWRISARLTNQLDSGIRETRARWGDAEFEALPHGVLLIFRGNEP